MLPQKLLYGNKVNSSFARNYTSIVQAQNTSIYDLGQTAIFSIPCSRNTVLSAADSLLNIRLKIRNPGAGAADAFLNKSGIAGAIQRVRVFANGTLICDIDNYNNLMNLLIPMQVSSDNVVGKNRILQGTNSERGAQIMANLGVNTDAPVFEYAFPLLSIMSLSDQYVPLYALQALRIEIQFVSTLFEFINSSRALTYHSDGTRYFSEVKMICNFIELSDKALDVIYRSLDGKPILWSCNTFSNFVSSNTLATAVTTVSIPVPCKVNSLRALYVTMRSTSAGALSTYSDDCPNFRLSSYQWRIGSRVLPADVFTTVSQFLAELERSMGCVSNKSPSSYTSRQITAATARGADQTYSQCFAVGLETESYSNVPTTSLYTGMNCVGDDIYFMPTFAAQDNATAVKFDTYALYDVLVVIDNGNVSVQY
jgi:hypothetical protein